MSEGLNDLNAKNLMFNYSINVVSLAYVAVMVAISIGFVRGFLPCLRYFLSDRSEIILIEFYFLLFFYDDFNVSGADGIEIDNNSDFEDDEEDEEEEEMGELFTE